MAQGEQSWLDQVRALALRGDLARAEAVLGGALTEYPGSFELRRALAGIWQQTGREQKAERLLDELLRERPADFATAFTLSRMMIAQARGHAAAQVLRACVGQAFHGPELAIQAIELLDEVDRKADAAAIAESALAGTPEDPRLHAYAGMLKLQLGDFDGARTHYRYALEHSPQACEWHAPLGLASAQRYTNPTHPDFALFDDCGRRSDADAGRLARHAPSSDRCVRRRFQTGR